METSSPQHQPGEPLTERGAQERPGNMCQNCVDQLRAAGDTISANTMAAILKARETANNGGVQPSVEAPEEIDPNYYFGAGDAWKTFNKDMNTVEGLPQQIGELIKNAGIAESVQVRELDTNNPLLSAYDIKILQLGMMFIGALNYASHAQLTGDKSRSKLSYSVMESALGAMVDAFMVQGATSPGNAATTIIVPLERKLYALHKRMESGDSAGLFEAPF
jgi:hypothetical protein